MNDDTIFNFKRLNPAGADTEAMNLYSRNDSRKVWAWLVEDVSTKKAGIIVTHFNHPQEGQTQLYLLTTVKAEALNMKHLAEASLKGTVNKRVFLAEYRMVKQDCFTEVSKP